MNHFMIDLETLSTQSNAVILTIGAIQFDPKGEVGETFYRRIDLSCYDKLKNSVDVNLLTISWWMKQSEVARQEAFLTNPRVHIQDALTEFIDWMKKLVNNKPIIPWSHGKDFDIVILQNYFNLLGISCPWKYWETQDTRTLYNLAKIDLRTIPIPNPDHVPHHAIGDCLKQISAVQLAYQKLSLS